MNFPKRVLSLALAVPLFFLTACGENASDPETSREATPTESSTTNASSASPSSSLSSESPTDSGPYKPATLEHPAQNVPVPKYPEAGKKDDKKGREAAAKFFFEAADYAKETGSDDALREVAFNECDECFAMAHDAKAWYDKGRWLAGGKSKNIEVSEEEGIDEYGRFRVNFILEESDSYAIRGEDSPSPTPQVGERTKGTLWVQYSPDHARIIVVQMQSYEQTPLT